MITPSALKQALLSDLPQPMLSCVMMVVNRHGHSSDLFTPTLFAQLLPLLKQLSSNAAEVRHHVLPLLLECLVGGDKKVYQNWVTTHTSPKALNFAASVDFIEYLSTAPHSRCVLPTLPHFILYDWVLTYKLDCGMQAA
jgi:hypothetical protein